jgi:hypothetical protein
MKMYRVFILSAAMATLLGCGGNANKKTTSETSTAETTETTPVKEEAAASTSSGDDMTGYWKLTLEAYDDNRNRKLDKDERQKGIRNRYTFRFNADGSCQIMDMYKGRYEVKTDGGKKMLSVYRNRIEQEEEKDPPPDVYQIISLQNGELVLLENVGDHTFWVFKK